MQTFTLTERYLELYKLLKIEAWVESGAKAKQVIAEQYVRVNGEIETRKRRKLVVGDTVEYNGNQISIGQ